MVLGLNLQGEQMSKEELANKPDINFYIQGKLMWLIDKTKNGNGSYKFQTLNELYSKEMDEKWSYEYYLNLVNNDPRYKYNNWRVPTKEELLTLELQDGFFAKMFAKDKEQSSIDRNIFYDDHGQTYWTCTKREDKDYYYTVNFGTYRFSKKSLMGSRDGHGSGAMISSSPRNGSNFLRLVRDIKE
jgi:hypothetical protein